MGIPKYPKLENTLVARVLKSFRGTNGSTYKTLIDTKVDYLFILTEDRKMYFIPCDKISNKATLNLSNEYLKYEVKI